jgi:hypothetical protein
MSSIEAIGRGASKTRVYNAARIRAAPTTRLFEDAQTVAVWRGMNFHPVPEADYAALLDNYGIRRTNRNFWAHSDKFQRGVREQDALAAGILDYNRLENR